jgi:hypothetical protein
LKQAILTFPFVAFLKFWAAVLPKIDQAQVYLQKSGLTLDQCQAKIGDLKLFLEENREKLVKESLEKALAICEELEIPSEERSRRRRLMPGEFASACPLTMEQRLRMELYQVVDALSVEIGDRYGQMDQLSGIFGFLQPSTLLNVAKDDIIKVKATEVSALYDEVSSSEIFAEVQDLRLAAKSRKEAVERFNFAEFFSWILEYELVEIFPNIVLLLRIFFTVSVSVASCERSFSKLKLIKTYLRSTMSDMRLSGLALLSIEKELAAKLDYGECIKEFASLKSRKAFF